MAGRRTRTQTRRGFPFLTAAAILGGLGFLALLGYAIWGSFQTPPILGEAVPIASREHIPDGSLAVDYNTDPPTSGQHYDIPMPAGFYDEAPQDEHLVHSLEHGYVIAYFNCTPLADAGCEELKQNLREAMGAAGLAPITRTPKIIVAPRPDMENLITYTSWGRIYRTDRFDRDEFLLFAEQNRNKAPEPTAP
jgi:hypothetical protein